MEIRLAGIVEESFVDGPGIRYVIFFQGCIHHCIGCHNPETHDLNGGYLATVKQIVADIKKNPLIDGVTFSGGEPLLQYLAIKEIINQLGKSYNYLLYTGYSFEDLQAKYFDLLILLDIVIDGRYEKTLHDETLVFRGSSNQRIIDVQKSLAFKQVMEVVDDLW